MRSSRGVAMSRRELFPPIEPYATGIAVDFIDGS